jgi:hypothetical protein
MPNALRYSFEDNLRVALGMEHESFHEQVLSEFSELRDLLLHPVCKFTIRQENVNAMRNILRDANVTARTVYPDLTGLGKFVADQVPMLG